jgi:hypothetical protein
MLRKKTKETFQLLVEDELDKKYEGFWEIIDKVVPYFQYPDKNKGRMIYLSLYRQIYNKKDLNTVKAMFYAGIFHLRICKEETINISHRTFSVSRDLGNSMIYFLKKLNSEFEYHRTSETYTFKSEINLLTISTTEETLSSHLVVCEEIAIPRPFPPMH